MKRALLSLLAAFASVAVAGCELEPYCLNCVDGAVPMDVQRSEVVSVDVIRDAASADSDATPCDPSRLMDDPRNCGSCGHVCSPDHAIPMCANGECVVGACDVGWIDLDHVASNGCEYSCIATGSTEMCDGVDNDCNGMIDEGFDLTRDPLHCGACATACTYANATPVCTAGACQLGACATEFADNDHDPSNGCEYHCPVYPPLPYEACNGLDDNCDGAIDEASALEAAPTSLCVTRAGTPCAGTVATCDTRGGVTTWYCGYGAGVEFDATLPNGLIARETRCDGIDNDCNGAVDDAFPDLGASCDNSLRGACRDEGVIRCDPVDVHRTTCDLAGGVEPVPGAPSAERCNNVDDDCDGTIDNTTGANRIVRDMVHITGGGLDFWIDRYEASRPDASATASGVVGNLSCSNAAVVPWTLVNWTGAQAACVAAGMRLCTAAEWTRACSAGANTYPYGATYQPMTCNGADYAATHALAPTGDAALNACVTATGVADLSGNAKEWTSEQQGSTSTMPAVPIYVVRGGSYESPVLGLTCGTTFSRAAADTSLADIGFRCCSPTAP